MIPNSILIFTDGASKGNPGPGGYGAVILNGNMVSELGGREERTTNNRMELHAATEAFSYLNSAGLHATRYTLRVYSDSSYLIGGITKWVSAWKQNGWKTKQKEDVLNRDLWEKLDELATNLKIEGHKVAGRADPPGNARADEIASAFGEGIIPELYSGPRSGYQINLSRIGLQTGSRSGKVYSYISLVDGVVMTHKTWDACKRRVEGKSGVRYRKALTAQEETEIMREFGAHQTY